MNRIFSNGPLKDFVINPFTDLIHKSNRLYIAAPFVTETNDLLIASKSGKLVDLLVGLNSATTPQGLSAVYGLPNFRIRYFTHRFHAKIYISDTAALVGSSNLTDGGLRSNREATIRLDEPDDLDAIEELRALFLQLWESAQVLTDEKLKTFAAAYSRVKHSGSGPDAIIEAAVGRAEPVNISVASAKKTPDQIFLEELRRQVYEQYRPSFREVTRILRENHLRRAELEDLGAGHDANRFLNWIRVRYASGDDGWRTAPLRPENERQTEIVRLGREWTEASHDQIPKDYPDSLRQLQNIFGTATSIEAASKEELTEGLLSIHALYDQLRFVKGGTSELPVAFWADNNQDVSKVKRTLGYLVHGRGDFIHRLHDVLYEPAWKVAFIGRFCALELYGTIKPEDCPPMNGRMAKALRYLGFDVRGA